MRPKLTGARLLCLAALALSTVGCGGTLNFSRDDWDDFGQNLVDAVYQMSDGPADVAGAVGLASDPQGWGGLSALGSDIAKRQWIEDAFGEPCGPAVAAGVVGAATDSDGWSRLAFLATAVNRGNLDKAFKKPVRLRSVFAVPPPERVGHPAALAIGVEVPHD